VPFVKADATKFSETGYVAAMSKIWFAIWCARPTASIKLAEYGIIYLDEIDRSASSGNFIGPDVSRTGVQRNLLKLMEESEVDLKTPHDLAAQMEAGYGGAAHRQSVAQKSQYQEHPFCHERRVSPVCRTSFGGRPESTAHRIPPCR
jgi:hypothetical protein